MNLVDPSTIHEHYSKNPSRVILDVLPDEIFEKRHIKDAVNACVYEIDFIEKVTTLIPDQNREIVIYGQNDQFEAALLAFEKLQSNGWTHVDVLRGGIENWESLGHPIGGNGFQAEPLNEVFEASIEKSSVRWGGRNLLNQHNGVVGLEKATLKLENDQLVGGAAVIDMTRIECEDIEDPSMAQMLIGHLRTDDFFLVEKYPAADFELLSAEAIPESHPGVPNYNIEGSFTLRGHTQQIRFPATLGKNDAVVALQASFDIDRVLWNSKYGSAKIYEALGKHVVNDLISISFQFIAPIK